MRQALDEGELRSELSRIFRLRAEEEQAMVEAAEASTEGGTPAGTAGTHSEKAAG
jgi:hypothetical protein